MCTRVASKCERKPQCSAIKSHGWCIYAAKQNISYDKSGMSSGMGLQSCKVADETQNKFEEFALQKTQVQIEKS